MEKFCQSCGMPLSEEVLGSNADGTKNGEYCLYCLQSGCFTRDCTMEEMIDFCSQFVDQYNEGAGTHLSQDEYKNELRKFFPMLRRWSLPADQLPSACQPLKDVLIAEINALDIPDMLPVNELYPLQGSFVNMEYDINGNHVRLLDDSKTYWGAQVEKQDGRCYGIACDEHMIVVSEYGDGGTDAEIVLMKRRG